MCRDHSGTREVNSSHILLCHFPGISLHHNVCIRVQALRDTVCALTGVKVTDVNDSRGVLSLSLDVMRSSVEITLDKQKRVHSIKMLNKEYDGTAMKAIVQEARQLSAPNDLRCAVRLLCSMQQ
jgi:hypothetical protein